MTTFHVSPPEMYLQSSLPSHTLTFFPSMITAFAPGYVFLFFCGMMVLQLVGVKLCVPETKGVPLEEMQQRLGIE